VSYVELSQIEGRLPRKHLLEALDDDDDGVIDQTAWELVQADVSLAIEGPLSARFGVPFAAPFPPAVALAARIFALEMLYIRRGTPKDQNPWTEHANAAREKLDKVGAGELSLQAAAREIEASVAAVTEPSRLHDPDGRIAV